MKKSYRIVALMLSLALIFAMMQCAVITVSADAKYILTPKSLTISTNGLDESGNTYAAGFNNSDQYLYFRPTTVRDGADFEVSFSYSLPAGTYEVSAAYKSRPDGAQTVDITTNETALGTISMQGSAISERNTRLSDLTLAAAGVVTFTYRVTAGSSNYMTIGNLVLTPISSGAADTFRFESETTPLVTVDSKGVSAAVNNVNDWYWVPSLNKDGIQGELSGDLAYFRSGGIGGYVEYTLPATSDMTTGEYDLWWSFRPGNLTYSTLDVAFNGSSVMEVSQKQRDVVGGLMNMNNVMKRLYVGRVTVKGDGTDVIRLTMISAEGASTQGFTSDYFELISADHEFADSISWEETMPAASSDLVESYPLYGVYPQSSMYKVTADDVTIPTIQYMPIYDYADFSLKMNAPTEITVEFNEEINSYSISPLKENIEGTVDGKKLTFTIDKAMYIIITINGNTRRLVISVNEPEENRPSPGGEGVFNVMDYGADATGAKLSSGAINAAMADAAEYGNAGGNAQGIVYVPAGVYSVSNIELKSNTNLYLAGGSVLRMADDSDCYAYMAQKVSLPGTYMTFMLYTEDHGRNISVTGRGTLDGRGAYTRSCGWTVDLLLMRSAENFTLDGPLFRESGMWAIIPAWSKDSLLENFKVFNNTSFNEDDAVDVVGGTNITIRHAIGITNDDTFSTKTYIMNEGANVIGYGSGPAIGTDGVVFEDCIAWSQCYGFKSGQGFAMEQKNITVKDSVVFDCAVAFGIHHLQNGDTEPHDIHDVLYENIDVEQITHTIWLNSCFATFYVDTPGNHKAAGNIYDLTVRNINVRNKGNSYSMLQGSTWNGVDWRVDNVTFENVTMNGKVATNLTELGFIGTNPTNHFSNPGVDHVNNSSGCYVKNPYNTIIEAKYFYSGANASVVDCGEPESDKAVTVSANSTLRYMGIDFGNLNDGLRIKYASSVGGTARVALDNAANIVGEFEVQTEGGAYQTTELPLEDVAGAHDIYIILPAGASLCYIQPYVVLSAEAVIAAIEALPEDESIDGDGLAAVTEAVNSAAQLLEELSESEKDKVSDELKSALAKKQEIVAAGGYTLWLAAQPPKTGDLDDNGTVNVSDVVALRQLIMSGEYSGRQLAAGDLVTDGTLNVSDVVALRQLIMTA